MKLTGKYLGNKKVELFHPDSGVKIITSAPKDNNGDGSSFSPTDLFVSSLGACLLTIMGIIAENKGIDLGEPWFEVEKTMGTNPRRVIRMPVVVHLPARLTADEREKIERAKEVCPVHHSLRESIEAPIEFTYDL